MHKTYSYRWQSSKSKSNAVILISDSKDEDDELAKTMAQISLNRASPTKRSSSEMSNLQAMAQSKGMKAIHSPPVYVFHQSSSSVELHTAPPPEYSESARPCNSEGGQSNTSEAPTTPRSSATLVLPPSVPGPSPPPPPPATPHRRSKVNELCQQDSDLVFKGFPTKELARASWNAVKSSGVVSAIQRGMGRDYWVVIQGVHPSIYRSAYNALRDGLEWGGGFLTAFSSEAKAHDYWNSQVNADPPRIAATVRPGFFD
ncbi:hypothetical protein EV361DRAFT_1019360 [Lentinula raphanica]|nr:hypothetical protein EV361DRAFT_1019360 [Lentinula raphanica]